MTTGAWNPFGFARKRFRHWWQARIPLSDTMTLSQRNVYILPSRAGIAVVRAAKAQALLSGRDYVAPDDVQAILAQTVAHRLIPVGDAGRGPAEQVRAMLEEVALP